MKNYSEMSNDELDRKIALCICRENDDGEHMSYILSNLICNVPKYTRSWADMGPIIEREAIVIAPNAHCEYVAIDGWIATKTWHVGSTEICFFESDTAAHENPLRAAAIVYLMSKEAEQGSRTMTLTSAERDAIKVRD